MKDNNKKINAFTLMELLAAIAIIGVITLLATITYNKVRKDVLEKQYINLELLIESAANKYAAKYGFYSFFVQELIDEGYLEPDDENNIYDPRDHSVLNCHLVTVTEERNGTLTSKLQKDSHTENGECKTSDRDVYASALELTAKLHDLNIAYPQNGVIYEHNSDPYPVIINGWTNKQLDLTGNTSRITDDLTNAKFIWNSDQANTTIYPVNTNTTNMVKFYNDYYYLDLYTRENKHYQARLKYKFDMEAPVVYIDKTKVIDNDTWKATDKTVIIYATDKDGVGLSKIYVGERPCTDMLTDNTLGNAAVPGIVQTYTISEELDAVGKNFNVCVSDKLGNVVNGGKVNVKKIDKSPPSIPTIELYKGDDSLNILGEYTSGTWTNKNVLTRLQSTDAYSAIDYYEYSHDNVTWTRDMENWQNHAFYQDKTILDYWITWEGSWNFYVRSCDIVGNCTTSSDMYNISIDKTPPTVDFDYSPHSNLITIGAPNYYSPITVDFSCDDDRSGVDDHHVTNLGDDSNVPLSWTALAGEHNIRQYCRDEAGNETTQDWDFNVQDRPSSGGGGSGGGSVGGGGSRCYTTGSCTVCDFRTYYSSECTKHYINGTVVPMPGHEDDTSVSGACVAASSSYRNIFFGCEVEGTSSTMFSDVSSAPSINTTLNTWQNMYCGVTATNPPTATCTDAPDGDYYIYRRTDRTLQGVRRYSLTRTKCNTFKTFAQYAPGGTAHEWKCQ